MKLFFVSQNTPRGDSVQVGRKNKEITANQRNVRRPTLSDTCERNEPTTLLCTILARLILSDIRMG